MSDNMRLSHARIGPRRTLSVAVLCVCTLAACESTRLPDGALDACAGSVEDVAAGFDAAQLRESRYTYDITDGGKPIGTITFEIRRQTNGEYRVVGDSEDFKQHWVSVLRKDFSPVSASLVLSGSEPSEMAIEYVNGAVQGTVRSGGQVRSIDERLGQPVVDSRIDWAAAMALTMRAGEHAKFAVYDTGSSVSPVRVTATGLDPVESVIGRQNAARLDYVVCKREQNDRYSVLATRDAPRVMFREDLLGGLVTHLIKVEP